MKYGLVLFILVSVSTSHSSVPNTSPQCPATREFVTTLEYLRANETLAGKEENARKIAEDVANGCEGAARRFIRTAKLLLKSGISNSDTVKYATLAAKTTDASNEAFISLFQKSFAREFFDLDQSTSLNLASSLSLEFKASPEIAKKDFETLAEFCLSEKGLAMGKPTCAQLASRIAKLSEKTKAPTSQNFIKTLDFLMTQDGANLTLAESLPVAEEVTGIKDEAPENFITAYKYAVKEKGLGLNRDEALKFARKMAKMSSTN